MHVLEVNARPALLDDALDAAVNRAMVEEIVRLVGFHVPASAWPQREMIRRRFGLSSAERHLTYEWKLYSRVMQHQDETKQWNHHERDFDREAYLAVILKDLSALDVRILIKLEEELGQARNFRRIFPTKETHKYFRFFERLSYLDKLADAYMGEYHGGGGGEDGKREEGLARLADLAAQCVHL